jgi:hypothetical protein
MFRWLNYSDFKGLAVGDAKNAVRVQTNEADNEGRQ